jgi:outer membrane protein W
VGNTKDFIEQTSFTGLGFDVRKFIEPKISVGFYAGWNAFQEEITNQSVSQDSNLIYSEKLMNSFPLLATFNFYFTDDRIFIPFIGGGVGVIYVFQSLKQNSATTESNRWHFGFSPEAGFAYLLGDIYSFFSLKYYYAAPAGNQIYDQSLSQTYFSLNIGIAFSSRGNF